MNLSTHFILDEFVRSETAAARKIDNTPGQENISNLRRVAAFLERVRTEVVGDLPITVTSGFRCTVLNAAVGGEKTSKHLVGLAADILCPKFGPPKKLAEAIRDRKFAELDQLIYEFYSEPWCHVGLTIGKPRGDVFSKFPGLGVIQGIVDRPTQ